MRGKSEFPDDVVGSGDVLSHLSKYRIMAFNIDFVQLFKTLKGAPYVYKSVTEDPPFFMQNKCDSLTTSQF